MSVESELAFQKRQYKRVLKDLRLTIETCESGIDDEDWEPSTAIDTLLHHAATIGGAIRALKSSQIRD